MTVPEARNRLAGVTISPVGAAAPRESIPDDELATRSLDGTRCSGNMPDRRLGLATDTQSCPTASFELVRQDCQIVPRVFILLSTRNGATFLRAQLDSLLAQSHSNWVIYWRDDESSDTTVTMLDRFAVEVGPHRCIRITEPKGRLWPAASFLALLRAALPSLGPDDTISFADQDDVWLPNKVDRAITALAAAGRQSPALYFAPLSVVDTNLRYLMETVIAPEKCGFPASLTQNVATGCTIMLNRSAAELIDRSTPPAASPHDWWCYLLITAAGGAILVDNEPNVLYRQHAGNYVGVPLSLTRRAVAALRRGPGVFMGVFRQHVRALVGQQELLTESARSIVRELDIALQEGSIRRLRALRIPGLRRQSWPENLLFRLWFLIG